MLIGTQKCPFLLLCNKYQILVVILHHPMLLEIPYKEICNIKGMEGYKGYYIDIEGNIWSSRKKRFRKLIPSWCNNKENPFLKIMLYDCNTKKGNWFYVHKLMSAAFLSEEHEGSYLIHKNNNHKDNSLENLAWTDIRPGRGNTRTQILERDYQLSDKVKREIKLVHRAALEKGLHMSESFSFINEVVEDMLEEYCSKRGLKKILYRMKNEGA